MLVLSLPAFVGARACVRVYVCACVWVYVYMHACHIGFLKSPLDAYDLACCIRLMMFGILYNVIALSFW